MSDSIESLPVIRNNSRRRARSVQNTLSFRPCFQNRSQFVIIVSRHTWEEVVLELGVHSTPNPCFERTKDGFSVSSRSELTIDVFTRARGVHNLFRLVRGADQRANNETAQRDRTESDLPRHARRQPDVVQTNENNFLPFPFSKRNLDRVRSPEPVHDGQQRVTVDVLPFAHGRVWSSGFFWMSEIEKWLHHDISVHVLFVRKRVVHGVLWGTADLQKEWVEKNELLLVSKER